MVFHKKQNSDGRSAVGHQCESIRVLFKEKVHKKGLKFFELQLISCACQLSPPYPKQVYKIYKMCLCCVLCVLFFFCIAILYLVEKTIYILEGGKHMCIRKPLKKPIKFFRAYLHTNTHTHMLFELNKYECVSFMCAIKIDKKNLTYKLLILNTKSNLV